MQNTSNNLHGQADEDNIVIIPSKRGVTKKLNRRKRARRGAGGKWIRRSTCTKRKTR